MITGSLGAIGTCVRDGDGLGGGLGSRLGGGGRGVVVGLTMFKITDAST